MSRTQEQQREDVIGAFTPLILQSHPAGKRTTSTSSNLCFCRKRHGRILYRLLELKERPYIFTSFCGGLSEGLANLILR